MLQKRLDYGFNGYHVPFVPRAARSARRRGLVQKKVKDTQLCAFDLLATVAGEILLESDTSHTAAPGTDLINVQNVVDEDDKVNRPLVFEHCDQGNIEAVSPSLTLELGLRGLDQDLNVKEVPGPTPDSYSSPSSIFPLTGHLVKNVSLEKIDLNTDLCCHSGKIENDSLGDRYGADAHSIEDPEVLDGKSPTLVSSDGSVKLTLGNDHYPCRDNNVNVVSRDDDENSSECIQPSTMKTTRLATRVGDRRIRKLFESKYRRIASKARNGDLFDIEHLYRSRKTGYKHLRSQRIYPFKRKRFYRYNYCDKPINATASDFGSVGVNGLSLCVAGQRRTFLSRESNVKLRIKSFRVPELFIEMSETSTIGSLKRTVMEAVSALLGGGLRVGLLLEGKKLRDDNRTLRQSGICHDNMGESLGFYLEPSNPQVGAPVHSEENSPLLRTGVPQPVSRDPITSLPADHLASNLGNFIESDHDSTPSPADLSVERGVASLHGGTPHSLAVAHSRQKSKRPDMGPRRIRRPFSVTEVESLVHAVEKLGTGRWRDVKIRGFDNVKHRTYVDLKDKWKTLVHTAGIAPQQRRGEPVPQELLDRVLAAHAYWTQHQSKQELKQPTETRLFL